MLRLLPLLLVVLTCLPASGCFYKVGSGLMAGVLDEAGGKGKSDGVDPVVSGLVEKALLAELGHQLGQGLQSGVADVTPEQRVALEATVDGLITVAMMRAGQGLRKEVSPELRALVTRDIVQAFAEGVRGELAPTLEETVDKLVTRAVVSLRRNLEDEETRFVTADLLRDSIYMALREGYASPAVGETVELTLKENVLSPVSDNVADITNLIATQVDAQAQRADRTLRSVIAALIMILAVGAILYSVQRRQLRRERMSKVRSEVDKRSFDVALEQLDEGTRAQVLAKLGEIRGMVEKIEVEEEKR
ncbi:MAG: hypothetical protein KC656_03660 [Myxococcales bacterium]|nr:hypothetical protein [Myxococcales bacterium]MCB9691763.1 hypothetical protein [Alphaproteobacteria bacterium]